MKPEAASNAEKKGTWQDFAPLSRMDLPSMGDQPPPNKAAEASLMQWKKLRKASLTFSKR
jgi:hypothetical protein